MVQGRKQTEIGLIPEDWEVVRLEKVAELIRGVSWRKDEANKSGIGLPVISIPNIGFGTLDFTFHHFLTKKVSDQKLLKTGDIILVGSSGSIHNVGRNTLIKDLPTNKISFASFLALIRRKKNEILSDFLYYLVNSDWVDFKKFVKRAADGKYNFQLREFQNNILIPLPPLEEQQKIARVLSTIQQAIEQQDKIIETTRKLKKSLLHKSFSEGLNGEEQKETEIGLIPKSWDVVRLGDITEKTKQTGKRKNPNNKFKYIDVSGISNKFFQIVEFKEYLGKEAPSRARKTIKANDIIFATVRPYLKRVAIVPEAFDGEICSTAFCVVRCKRETTNPIFVFNCLLNDTFVDKVSELQRGSSYPAVTDKDVLNQKIPRPPLSEQQQIAHILSTVDKKIAIEERRKTTLKELFKSMLHKLMSGEIRLKEVEV